MQLGIIDGEVDKTRFYKQGINFYSVGALSNNFIKALTGLYKTDNKSLMMIDKVESTTFVLDGQPEKFDSDYIKTKIFFDDMDEKGFYSEWYVNVDLKNKIWRIPALHIKQFRRKVILGYEIPDFLVPLSDQALEILDEAMQWSLGEKYIFSSCERPDRTSLSMPFGDGSFIKPVT